MDLLFTFSQALASPGNLAVLRVLLASMLAALGAVLLPWKKKD